MDKFYPPHFTGYIPLPNGKPAAGGKLYAYRNKTDIPAPLFDEQGQVIAGSRVDIDSNGCVHCLLDPTITYTLKVVPPPEVGEIAVYDNVRVAECHITGMTNPMTDRYDLIVGGVNGEPDRLGTSFTMGQVLAVQSNTGLIGWTDLSILLPELANIGKVKINSNDTSLGFIGDKMSGDGVMRVATAPDDSSINIGINADLATNGQVMTADGNGGCGWAAPAVQTGDHKVLGATGDSDPGYLSSKILGGGAVWVELESTPDGDGGYLKTLRIHVDARGQTSGKVLTADGSDGCSWQLPVGFANPMTTSGDMIVAGTGGAAARLPVGADYQILTSLNGAVGWAAPTVQTGDHQLLVSATDAAAGYLGAKLTAGSNITLTPQTDGDGVQTLEISATGGGGGGASDWREVLPATNRSYQVSSQASGLVRRFYPLGPTVRSVMVMTANYKVGATCKGHIRIYKMQIPNGSTESAEATATMTSIAHKEFTLTVKSGVIWVSFDADVDVSNTSYQYFYAIGFNNSANPNPSDYLKFQLSAAVSTSGTALYPVEFHVSTNKLIDSTMPNTLGYTAGDYTYVSGISSKVES